MSTILITDVNALAADAKLSSNNAFQSQTITRLTSGYRIETAGDDPTGIAIADKYRSGTAEFTEAVNNLNAGVGMLQIMDGGMTDIAQMLDRLKTLATQSASDSFTGDRNTVNSEFQTLLTEIDREAQQIGLNTSGQYAQPLAFYGGGGNSSEATVNVDLSACAVDTQGLGLATSMPGGANVNISVTTQDSAQGALTAISAAVDKLGVLQAVVAKGENQCSSAMNQAQSQITNFSAGDSGLRDADMAAEASNLTRSQILQQASLAAISQANLAAQAVLTLLKG
ncbi:MAG: hypothetical protein JO323_05450 [Acidobacteriia bacterium]|nr:hypothetical protein [Terriglobia bacterium]